MAERIMYRHRCQVLCQQVYENATNRYVTYPYPTRWAPAQARPIWVDWRLAVLWRNLPDWSDLFVQDEEG